MIIEISLLTVLFLSWLTALFACEAIVLVLIVASMKNCRVKIVEFPEEYEKENHF